MADRPDWVPQDVWDGMDVLLADGLTPEKAAEVCWAAHRNGQDALTFAHHFVKLRTAFRREPSPPPPPCTCEWCDVSPPPGATIRGRPDPNCPLHGRRHG